MGSPPCCLSPWRSSRALHGGEQMVDTDVIKPAAGSPACVTAARTAEDPAQEDAALARQP
jgi:hypothetical protein